MTASVAVPTSEPVAFTPIGLLQLPSLACRPSALRIWIYLLAIMDQDNWAYVRTTVLGDALDMHPRTIGAATSWLHHRRYLLVRKTDIHDAAYLVNPALAHRLAPKIEAAAPARRQA